MKLHFRLGGGQLLLEEVGGSSRWPLKLDDLNEHLGSRQEVEGRVDHEKFAYVCTLAFSLRGIRMIQPLEKHLFTGEQVIAVRLGSEAVHTVEVEFADPPVREALSWLTTDVDEICPCRSDAFGDWDEVIPAVGITQEGLRSLQAASH